MQRLWVIGVSALVFSFVAVVYYAVVTNNALFESRQRQTELTSQLSAANQTIQHLEAELEAVRRDLAEAQDSINTLNETIALLEGEKEALALEKEQIEAERDKLSREVRGANQESARLERELDKLLCSKQIEMDYSSVLSASSRLIGYVSSLPNVAHVGTTLRNTLWNNADSKVHIITYTDREDGGYYSMQFLVYMDEFGWEPATFFIDGQCWVDPP
jgi:DNA repair exonuclease SbcCD ATPase subunit